MGKLVNVRLSDEELAMVKKLRREGETLSDFLRTSLRKRFKKTAAAPEGPGNAYERILWLDKKYPAARGKRHRIDLTNRHEVSAFIRARLIAKRKRILRDWKK